MLAAWHARASAIALVYGAVFFVVTGERWLYG
jgi:hypothetical protein